MDKVVINKMLRPKSVAVVGASATPGKIGYTVVKNLIKDGYKGAIYPINQKEKEILGVKCYPSLQDVPGEIDSAILCVPASVMKDLTIECGKKGVKGLIVITSGFSEVGRKDLEDEIVSIAHSYGMRVLGPNIVGSLSNSDQFNGSFAPCLPLPGKASLITQSGALLIALDMATYTRRVGFDKLISIGNMADVDFADLIDWFYDDDQTSCVSLYIEGLRDGRKFIDSARNSKKPIIALKSGVSAHGAAAAASHTGSLAGAAKIYGSAFAQAGVIQASDLDNLFDRTLALSSQPPMKGDHMLILTNGGGVGVLATDAAEKFGVPLQFAPPEVQTEMKKHMPEFGSAKNPVDMTGMAGNEWYYETVKYALTNDWVDSVVVLYCETAITNPPEIAESIKRAVDESGVKDKPVTVSFVGGEKSEAAMGWLVEHGLPAYFAPDVAVNAMAALREYARLQDNKKSGSEKVDEKALKASLEIIESLRAVGPSIRLTVVGDRSLREACPDPGISWHDRITDLAPLMAASDLLITKPGGLVCSEALTAGLPMLFTSPIPLQETLNAVYLQGQGTGILCESAADIGRETRRLTADPGILRRMVHACQRMYRRCIARIAQIQNTWSARLWYLTRALLG